MTEYKQWHEEVQDFKQFNSQGQVYFCQCDKFHKLSLFELLRMVTDAAVEDFNQRCMSYDRLTDSGIGILLSKQSFRFHKMPVGNQKITVRTWEEKPEPLTFARSYQILDSESGECLVTGDSRWILVDLAKRRLMPLKFFTMRVPPENSTEHDCLPLGKISLPENAKLLCERTIWFSDIDGNGHMNNARYGSFVVDALPEEYQGKNFTDFRINYITEAVQGEKVQIFGSFDDQQKKAVICGKQMNGTCFESELYWD